jgi:hypothetical protein
VTAVPTRWRTTFEDQLGDAERRLAQAESFLAGDDGRRALQESYRAVVAAATVKVWLAHPPWRVPLGAPEMQRKVRESFPNQFAVFAAMDMKDVLTSPWPTQAVGPYVADARAFVAATRAELQGSVGGA